LTFSLEYDLFIVAGLTYVTGYLLQKSSSFFVPGKRTTDKLFPYALAYIPISLGIAFLHNDLPLRGFSIDPVYDTPGSSNLGPQSINGDAVIAMVIVLVSVAINIVVWLYALFLVIRGFTKKHKVRKATRTPNYEP
jgi:hypothetical protein